MALRVHVKPKLGIASARTVAAASLANITEPGPVGT
jgi:hypothetical protein